jgi:hypothetical protein
VKKRRWPWLAAAAALFVGAALLMSIGAAPRALPPQVKLPRNMDRAARERLERRKTLPRFVVAGGPAEQPSGNDEPRPLLDPVIAAMPATVKHAAVVIEANALRYSPVGKLFIDCFVANEGAQLEKLKAESGLDPLNDVDRVSVIDDTVLVTGRFSDAKWATVFKNATSTELGPRTTLWQGGSGQPTATWNGQMIITGPNREAITAVVDRLEGRTPPPPHPVLDEHDSYGEIYGVVAPAAIGDLLAREQPALAERLRAVVDRVSLHVDASHDVGIVADATGAGQDTGDLGKAVGSALTVGRLAAQAQGKSDLAEVLDYARVSPHGTGKGFRTELALPLAFFQEKLRDCAQRKRRGGAAPP